MMKKITLILVLMLTLVACGNKSTDKPEDQTPDGTSTASVTNDANELVASLSENGNWITAITADVTLSEPLVVNGKFHNRNDTANDVYRKLALHTQDDDFNVIDNFTLTVPVLEVRSENFTVFFGTIVGDVHVFADGFTLHGTKVEGNVVFETEAQKDSADLTLEGATVAGDVTVTE